MRTERLTLRRWRPEDAAPMTAINSDPAVTEFLNRRMDAAATASFLDRTRNHWAEHGFGHWAVHPENDRSRRVAEKLGMKIDRQVHNPVHDLDVDIWQVPAR